MIRQVTSLSAVIIDAFRGMQIPMSAMFLTKRDSFKRGIPHCIVKSIPLLVTVLGEIDNIRDCIKKGNAY